MSRAKTGRGAFHARLPWRFPSLSFRLDLTGHCAEGGGSEVLMQVASLSARIRMWLGLVGTAPAKVPDNGAGAWAAARWRLR